LVISEKPTIHLIDKKSNLYCKAAENKLLDHQHSVENKKLPKNKTEVALHQEALIALNQTENLMRRTNYFRRDLLEFKYVTKKNILELTQKINKSAEVEKNTEALFLIRTLRA
jgi:hypothetical protein